MIKLAAILDNFRSLKDKTAKITFETNELTPDQWAEIGKCSQQFGYLIFKIGEKNKDIEELAQKLPELEFEGNKKKSKSQRQRNILYLLWEQKNEGYEDSEDHYNYYMDKIFNHLSNKLDKLKNG